MVRDKALIAAEN